MPSSRTRPVHALHIAREEALKSERNRCRSVHGSTSWRSALIDLSAPERPENTGLGQEDLVGATKVLPLGFYGLKYLIYESTPRPSVQSIMGSTAHVRASHCLSGPKPWPAQRHIDGIAIGHRASCDSPL